MNNDARGAQESQQNSKLAMALVAAAAILAAVSAALLGSAGGPAAGWCAGIGGALIIIGALGGIRGAVGAGVIGIAIASVVETHESSLGYTLAVNAAVALACLTMLAATDLSFTTRRNTIVAPATLQGFIRLHTTSAVVGVGVAVAALGVVLSIDWPGALLLLPAVVLAGGAAILVAVTRRHKHLVREQRAVEGPRLGPNGLPPGPLHNPTAFDPPRTVERHSSVDRGMSHGS